MPAPLKSARAALAQVTAEYDDTISFFLNGTAMTIPNPNPTTTLLNYLRNTAGLTGTKLGCAEGGCGACTVVIGSVNPTTGMLYHAAVNACLAPLVSVDGKHVITVEGIGSSVKPHPVQERIAGANGSQCGFCTPGIVMSMYALLRNNPNPTPDEIEAGFDGNLCRCTGYRPILDAAQTFAYTGGPAGGPAGAGAGCCMGKTSGGGCCRTGSTDSDSDSPPPCSSTSDSASTATTTTSTSPTPKLKQYAPDSELIFPPRLHSHDFRPLAFGNSTRLWLRPVTVEQLLEIKHAWPEAKIVGGSSEIQIEVKFKAAPYDVCVYVGDIPLLRQFSLGDGDESDNDGDNDSDSDSDSERTGNIVLVGGNIPLTDLDTVTSLAIKRYGPNRTQAFAAIAKQLHYFAGTQIRNVATPAGNIATASPISDLNPVLVAAGAEVVARSLDRTDVFPLATFFTGYRKTVLPPDAIISAIRIPVGRERGEHVRSYKQAKRKDDDIAIVTACFRVVVDDAGTVESATLAYGGMAPMTVTAKKAADFLTGAVWADPSTLEGVLLRLEQEFNLPYDVPGGMATYRRSLALGFFYRFWHDIVKGTDDSSTEDDSAVTEIERALSGGTQYMGKDTDKAVIGSARPHVAALKQATGEAQYTDDIPHTTTELYASLVLSSRPHARLVKVDPSPALEIPGVRHWIDHTDLPSPEANFWGIVHDEPFFAVDTVYTAGQPIGLVLADTAELAERASRAVAITYEDLPVVLSIEDAIEHNSFFDNYDHAIKNGPDPKTVFETAEHVISGTARIGGQEHFYLETNAVVVVPATEDGALDIVSSTQNPTEVQTYAAQITGVDANKVVVRVKRLGGGFGGKETRSVQLACLCALGAKVSRRPVRAMLDRDVDIITCGQRHPFLSNWTVAVDSDGTFRALDADIYANAGWSADLTSAVVDRALSHVDNVYRFPSVHVRGYMARTNTVSNTAFRGFGGPQGMFITETIVSEVADRLGLSPETIRERNMYRAGEKTHFNQALTDWHVPMMYDRLIAESDYRNRRAEVDKFNSTSRWRKRGLALIPTKFGISFTATHLNQAGALVHIYQDGSVLVAHGGTEMGQGLHTKMIMIAADALAVPVESVSISETATNTVANTSPTAASASSDMNGYAVLNACRELNSRLAPFREQLGPDAPMSKIAKAAYFARVNLSANGYYRTPEIGYDWATNTGRLAYYFTQGVAAAEVEIDTLTGDWTCLRADIKMDVGRSLNPAIDIGQIEGAFVQGQGLFTTEQSLWHGPSGTIATKGPGAYKIPSFRDVPQRLNVSLLTEAEADWAELRTVHRSRGVGEPPLFLGSAVFFAIRDALSAARAEWGIGSAGTRKPMDESEVLRLRSPATVERIRTSCADPLLQRCVVPPKGKPFFVEI